MLELTAEEARVAGSLAEKHLTTPQYYPLTLNALVSACNQSNNRDPVVSYDAATVAATLDSLRAKGVARVIHAGGGNRTTKYRHVLDEALGVDQRELALLTVLLLRGPQTLNELRTRTERMADFDGADAVAHDLARLADRDDPLVVHLERQPGQKETRWATLLTPVPERSVRISSVSDRRNPHRTVVEEALDELERDGAVSDETWLAVRRHFKRAE